MKKIKINSVIGTVVQVPVCEFAPYRTGWNGWLFQAGIITAVGTSKKTGKRMFKVCYPNRNYAQSMRNMNGEFVGLHNRDIFEKWFNYDCVFERDLFIYELELEHEREYWCTGSYSADAEFLIDKGILK